MGDQTAWYRITVQNSPYEVIGTVDIHIKFYQETKALYQEQLPGGLRRRMLNSLIRELITPTQCNLKHYYIIAIGVLCEMLGIGPYTVKLEDGSQLELSELSSD